MIADLDSHPTGPERAYDLVIVGSGPAGATVAAELAGRGLAICVLESGLARTTAHHDALRHVESAGIHVKEYSRERVLGGASTTWAGLSSPLDEADLRHRPWLAHSGWPVTRAELWRDWRAAAERYRFADEALFDEFRELRARGALQPRWSAVDEKVFLACDEPQDFGREQRHLYEAGGVDLWLDATVTELVATDGGARVEAARVRTRGGREHLVRGRAFVLATGGLENARLLLASRGAAPAGLGNERDQVGRYLMNHPKNYLGVLHLAQPVEDVPYFFGCLHRGYAGYAGLRFGEDEQERRGLLNSYVRLEPLFPWSDSHGVEALVLLVKRSAFVLRSWKRGKQDEVVELRDYSETGDDSDFQNERKSLLGWLKVALAIPLDARRVGAYLYHRLSRKKPRIERVRLRNFMEMEPRPENRVTLTDARDANGVPVPRAVHDTSALDRRSLVELHEVLARELAASGVGRLETDLATRTPWPITEDASHHLGTTRMGSDPATSVCDPNLKLHTVENVYCAGGSVFPTSGCANPTFTIVALSIRLARHLATEVFALEEAARG
ncbi:MAG: GMC family oxidoreductase [Planctomycetes bacterium]|nr:GMC family oxidoreductase [Planctomycetota bacterium]